MTRDSLLTLGPDLGFPATEEPISVEQWREGCASGEITEVFACGTAAVITPVGSVKAKSGGWQIGDGEPGPVTMRLREELLGIQFGRPAGPARLDPQDHLAAWIYHGESSLLSSGTTDFPRGRPGTGPG